jgi:benzodiazapine receptor
MSSSTETNALIGHKDDELTPRQLLPYRVANFVVFGAVIVLNVLSGAGAIGPTNANISDSYPNSFVPAGWAFSIWGPIYLWVAAFCL